MVHFFKKISEFISNQIPTEYLMKECDWRTIIHLHHYVEIDAIWQQKIDSAIKRISAQMPLAKDCSCRQTSILLYKDDVLAIKRLINNHCFKLAEIYSIIPERDWFRAAVAEVSYQKYTNLLLRIK